VKASPHFYFSVLLPPPSSFFFSFSVVFLSSIFPILHLPSLLFPSPTSFPSTESLSTVEFFGWEPLFREFFCFLPLRPLLFLCDPVRLRSPPRPGVCCSKNNFIPGMPFSSLLSFFNPSPQTHCITIPWLIFCPSPVVGRYHEHPHAPSFLPPQLWRNSLPPWRPPPQSHPGA